MNCAIAIKGSNDIRHFVRDAIKRKGSAAAGWNFAGSNCHLQGVKDTLWDFIWTNDDCQPVLDGSGRPIGWDKEMTDLTPGEMDIEITKENHAGVTAALRIRRQIANLTYSQIDSYIEANVTDMASARTFLKLLSKVTLSIIKIQDSKE